MTKNPLECNLGIAFSETNAMLKNPLEVEDVPYTKEPLGRKFEASLVTKN